MYKFTDISTQYASSFKQRVKSSLWWVSIAAVAVQSVCRWIWLFCSPSCKTWKAEKRGGKKPIFCPVFVAVKSDISLFYISFSSPSPLGIVHCSFWCFIDHFTCQARCSLWLWVVGVSLILLLMEPHGDLRSFSLQCRLAVCYPEPCTAGICGLPMRKALDR